MKRPLIVLVLLVLAGCQGNDGAQQAAPTTSATTTTAPDPASTACREHRTELKERDKNRDAALDQLTLSRDSRIVAAAREVESILQDRALDPDAIPAQLDLDYAKAELELARACKVAGYLP
jgi:hypothetical protein